MAKSPGLKFDLCSLGKMLLLSKQFFYKNEDTIPLSTPYSDNEIQYMKVLEIMVYFLHRGQGAHKIHAP